MKRKPASTPPAPEATLGPEMDLAKEQARALARIVFELWLEQRRQERKAA